MSPTCPSNAIPLFWPREILPDQFSRVARVPIPCAVMAIPGKAFDPLHMTAEIKSAAAQDLPHAVRRREAVSILPRVGAGAQRNRCAPNDLGQSATIDWPTGHREVGGSAIPSRTSDLQPAHRRNGAQHLVPVAGLSRAHERCVAVVASWRILRWGVTMGVHALRQEPHVAHTRR